MPLVVRDSQEASMSCFNNRFAESVHLKYLQKTVDRSIVVSHIAYHDDPCISPHSYDPLQRLFAV